MIDRLYRWILCLEAAIAKHREATEIAGRPSFADEELWEHLSHEEKETPAVNSLDGLQENWKDRLNNIMFELISLSFSQKEEDKKRAVELQLQYIEEIMGVKRKARDYGYLNLVSDLEETREELAKAKNEISKLKTRVAELEGKIPVPVDRKEREQMRVRAACRRRMPIDGPTAQALEHAITITERERDKAYTEIAELRHLLNKREEL